MIKIIDGNLLKATTDVVAHQVNCQGAFNSGVAKAIRNYDIEIYNDYHNICKKYKPEELIGKVRYFRAKDGKIFANLFGQKNYGYDHKQYTDVNMLKKCFENLRDFSIRHGNLSIAMPYKIGCVRGGADWNQVYEIINEVFKNCNVELWRLDLG